MRLNRQIMTEKYTHPGAVKAKMLLFGPLAENMGTRQIDLALDLGTSVSELAERFEFGELSKSGINVAINGVVTKDFDSIIEDGSEIAFLPPVSGG